MEVACICVITEGAMSDEQENSREADINETNERTIIGGQSQDNHGSWGHTTKEQATLSCWYLG